MIKLSGAGQDTDGTQPALTTTAVPHQINPLLTEGVEHGLVARHCELMAVEILDADDQFLRGETAAGREGLKTQTLRRAIPLRPGALRPIAHRDRATDVELAVRVQAIDLSAEVNPSSVGVQKDFEPVVEQLPSSPPKASCSWLRAA